MKQMGLQKRHNIQSQRLKKFPNSEGAQNCSLQAQIKKQNINSCNGKD